MATLNLWYNFSKRKNSTKAPSGAADHSVDAKLKEETSLANPVFIVVGDLFAANYAQFAGMYYYVDDIVSIHNGLCEVHCSKDVLATYKSNIQAASAHVLYYNHANTEIADKRISIKASQNTESNYGSFGFLGKNHCYILTVIGENGTAAFVLNQAQIKALYAADYMTSFDNSIAALTPVGGATAADAIIDLVRWWCDYLKSAAGAFTYAGTISENIKSCIILPVQSGAIGGIPNVDLMIGGIDTLIDAFMVTDRVFTDSAQVTIPWQASDWRRLEPYHEVFLYIPALGLISLSASDLIGETSLGVSVSMDVLSGDTIFEVKSSTKTVYYANTNLATGYALGSSQTSPAQAINALIGAVEVATGNPMLVAGGYLGIANSLKPSPTCIGANSGGAILGVAADTIKCTTVFHDTAVTPSSLRSIIGEPYNGVMSLSGISGYVQTANASIDIPGFGSDKDQVNSFLNGGIYIE